MTNKEDGMRIFTDGASRGNPGPGGWGAIVVLDDVVKELGGREDETTNNRMELSAVIGGLEIVPEDYADDVTIYTDSSYVINGSTKWIHGWKKNGWVTATKSPVLNKDLWMKLVTLLEKISIKWVHLPGHSGIPGNEQADTIATQYADNSAVKLFHGPLSAYPIDVTNVSFNETARKDRSDQKARSRAKAYSYLSLVDGVIMRHSTWPMCEARVKGKRAKFKKALSADEEREIVESWGFTFGDIVNNK